jgi:thymidylate kinase
MKLVIIESGDGLGKNSLIKGLCDHYNYDNMTLRHFGKPPKNLSPEKVLEFQFKCFNYEADLYHYIKDLSDMNYNYFENIIIWNRSPLGEYVYGSMFRKANPQLIKDLLTYYEKFSLNCLNDNNIYLISLTSDPEFFLKQEDGQSFSKTLQEKTKELELFKEVHEFSNIKNKLMIKVDNEGLFRLKADILNEVLNFIK